MLWRVEFNLAYYMGGDLTSGDRFRREQLNQSNVRCSYRFKSGFQGTMCQPLPAVLPVKGACLTCSGGDCGFDLEVRIPNRQGLEVFPVLPEFYGDEVVGFKSLETRWEEDLFGVRHIGTGGVIMTRDGHIINAVCMVTNSSVLMLPPVQMRVYPLNIVVGYETLKLRANN